MSDIEKSNTNNEATVSTEAAVAMNAQVQPVAIPTAIPVNPPSPSPSKTTSQEFLEFDGNTIFAPSLSTTYRYSLSLKHGKLRIWLEDYESKKQWCSAGLSVEDYVDFSNHIPDAIASDYVECFQELLSSASDNMNNIPCTFQRHEDGVFRLELAVKIQVLRQSRVATYTFTLETISVERIDVLESKLYDLQDEMEILRNEDQKTEAGQNSAIQKLEEGVKKLQKDVAGRDAVILQLKDEVKAMHVAQESSLIIPLQAGIKTPGGDLVCWKTQHFSSGSNAYVTGIDGIVRVESPGTYLVSMVISHLSDRHNFLIQIMKGADCILSAHCGYAQGYSASTSLTCTVRLDKNDQLTVKCAAGLTGISYLTLVRLGK